MHVGCVVALALLAAPRAHNSTRLHHAHGAVVDPHAGHHTKHGSRKPTATPVLPPDAAAEPGEHVADAILWCRGENDAAVQMAADSESAAESARVCVPYNSSDDTFTAPFVSNSTIVIPLPHRIQKLAGSSSPWFGVAGLRIRRPGKLACVIGYALANVLATSVIPLPLAGTLTGVGVVLFGLAGGLALNVLSAALGAYLGLLGTRHCCRPCFLRNLGKRAGMWRSLDAALAEHGWQIPLLVRCSPISPVVLTNVALALTSVSTVDYVWTLLVGEALTNLPYAYAAQLGLSIAHADLAHDPLMLCVSVAGLGASIAIAWKVAVVTRRLLQQHSHGLVPPASPSTGAVAHVARRRSDVAPRSPASPRIAPAIDPDGAVTYSSTVR